jgi:hypothetical protein
MVDHAPAHYRVFRNYLEAFSHHFGNDIFEARSLVPKWNALIDTSYNILGEAHCVDTGLITNCASWIAFGLFRYVFGLLVTLC